MRADIIWNERDRARYEKYANETVYKGYRTATLLSMFLFPPGVILDWFTHPEQFPVLVLMRILAAFGCGIMYFASRTSFVKQKPFAAVLIYFATVSLSITGMCLILEGYKSPYYAGVNLVILVAGILLPKISQIVCGAIVILAGYYVPILIQSGLTFDRPDLFINNMSFFLWTTLLAIGCGWLKERLQKESFSRLISIEESQKKLAESNEKIQRAEELRSRFFANISHEFRTPLTLILEHSRKLLKVSASPSERAPLELIIGQSQLILRHVNDLLDIAKIEAGKHSLACRKIDLAAHFRKVLEIFNVVAADRKIQFSVQAPETLEAVVDPEKVERILLNLVSNAFKFCPEGATISCTLAIEANHVKMQVEDNGPGIPAHLSEKIFDRFHQGEAVDTRQHGGTGLGLSIVKEFTELHGGKTWVEPSSGGGAKFCVQFEDLSIEAQFQKISQSSAPQIIPSEDVTRSLIDELMPKKSPLATPPLIPISERTVAQPQGSVLIIEDSVDLNRYLAECLSDFYEVHIAYDGQQGLDMATQLNPDLILCDMMLPRRSGENVLALVRENPKFENTPFIILTAKADDELRIRLLSNGADDYIMKPFVIAEVLARVKNLMSIKKSRDLLLESLKLSTGDLHSLSAEIVERKSQLENLTQCLELAQYHGELSFRAKSRFLSMVSHELKTPLTIVELSLQLLKKQRVNDLSNLEAKEFARAAQACQQLVKVIDTLLTYSEFEKGDLQFKIQSFEVNETLSELVAIFKPRAEQKNLQLFITGAATKPIYLESDVKIFRLIVLNLLENAMKFTASGSIEVTCEQSSQGVQVAIKDTGLGIPEERRSTLFEPFDKIYSSTVWTPRGLGLGLCLIKELLSLLEGDIEMQSEVGVGSTFRILLPNRISTTALTRLTHDFSI